MRKQIKDFIEKLSPTMELGRGGIAQSPIMIGDIIFHANIEICFDEDERKDRIYNIWCLWVEFGNKSLQEIVEESGWEEVFSGTHPDLQENSDHSCRLGATYSIELKDPNAKDLFEFLLTIFKDEK